MSVSGSDNLLVMVWLPGLHAIYPFEAHLAERFPHLKVRDRTGFLHSRKRMGRLLDATGRAIGHVPFSSPQVRARRVRIAALSRRKEFDAPRPR
ncbi:hypothetical protein ACFVH0_00610 [Streptomyces sp. NPDC127117]|uniref:hypothetical protein n=1 Tax=Streptomyces sp. NPDC127117 TaxID=3345368 RepID=UPI0036414B7F